jgi:hypothetical protein
MYNIKSAESKLNYGNLSTKLKTDIDACNLASI